MTRAVEIRAPSGETEGTRSQILRWLKRLGESVAENEPLIEIETDKVTVELASPGSGVLREILKQEQEEIAPGELLGRMRPGRSVAYRTPRSASASPSTWCRACCAPRRTSRPCSRRTSPRCSRIAPAGARSSRAAERRSP